MKKEITFLNHSQLTREEERFFATLEDLDNILDLDYHPSHKEKKLKDVTKIFSKKQSLLTQKWEKSIEIFHHILSRNNISGKVFILTLDMQLEEPTWSSINSPKTLSPLNISKTTLTQIKKGIRNRDKLIYIKDKRMGLPFQAEEAILLSLEAQPNYHIFFGLVKTEDVNLSINDLITYQRQFSLITMRLSRLVTQSLQTYMEYVRQYIKGKNQETILSVCWQSAKALGAQESIFFISENVDHSYYIKTLPENHKRNIFFEILKESAKDNSTNRVILQKKEFNLFEKIHNSDSFTKIVKKEQLIDQLKASLVPIETKNQSNRNFDQSPIHTGQVNQYCISYPIRSSGWVSFTIDTMPSSFIQPLHMLTTSIGDELSLYHQIQSNKINEKHQTDRANFIADLDAMDEITSILEKLFNLLEKKYAISFPFLCIIENGKYKCTKFSHSISKAITKKILRFLDQNPISLSNKNHPAVKQHSHTNDFVIQINELSDFFSHANETKASSFIKKINKSLNKELKKQQAKITLLKIPKLGFICCFLPHPLPKKLERVFISILQATGTRVENISTTNTLERERSLQAMRANAVHQFEQIGTTSGVIQLILKVCRDNYSFQELRYFEFGSEELVYWGMEGSVFLENSEHFPFNIFSNNFTKFLLSHRQARYIMVDPLEINHDFLNNNESEVKFKQFLKRLGKKLPLLFVKVQNHGLIVGHLDPNKISETFISLGLLLKTASLRLETLNALKRIEIDVFHERARANFGDQLKLHTSQKEVFDELSLYLRKAHNLYHSAIFFQSKFEYLPKYIYLSQKDNKLKKLVESIKDEVYLVNDGTIEALQAIHHKFHDDDEPYFLVNKSFLKHFKFRGKSLTIKKALTSYIKETTLNLRQLILIVKIPDYGFILATLEETLKAITQFRYMKLVLQSVSIKLKELQLIKEQEKSFKRERFRAEFNTRLNTSNSTRDVLFHIRYLISNRTTLYLLTEAQSDQLIPIELFHNNRLLNIDGLETKESEVELQHLKELFGPRKIVQVSKDNPVIKKLLSSHFKNISELAQSFYCLPIGQYNLIFLAKDQKLDDDIVHEVFIAANLKFAILTSEKAVQNLRVQEEKAQILGRTSWAIGHKLNNLLLQLKSSYAMGKDLQFMFQEVSFQVRSLMDQTQNRSVPAKIIDLNEFVHTTCTIAFYNNRHISFTYQLDHNKPFAFVKAAVLRDIINNLTNNALRHGKAKKLFIHTQEISENKSILKVPSCQIEISDDGIGIPRDVLKRGLGAQGNTSHPEGTGMGLHQVINDLKEMGGHFEYFREKKISRFLITIPKLSYDGENKKQAPLTTEELQRDKILIIDDDSANRLIFKDLLYSMSFQDSQIIIKQNAEEAIEYLNHLDSLPSAIISDLYMHQMTGLELFQWIKKNKGDIYFCLISGNQESEEIQAERRNNFKYFAFIQKGIEGLDYLEQFVISAIRKTPIIQKENIYNKAAKIHEEQTENIFWEGFTHRMNNILLPPMSSCEFIIDFKNEDFKKRFNTKEAKVFLLNFEILLEISKLEDFANYLHLHLTLYSIANEKAQYDIKKVSHTINRIKELQQNHGDTYPPLQTAFENHLDCLIQSIPEDRETLSKALKPHPIIRIFGDSTGKIGKSIKLCLKDKAQEDLIKEKLYEFSNEIHLKSTDHLFKNNGEPDYSQLLQYCKSVSNSLKSRQKEEG